MGAWTFDNISGTTVYDDSGNNNNGTAYGGPAVVNGVIGKALSFNGSNNYVGCGSGVNLDMAANDFTVAVWAKAAGGTYGKGIINKGGWGSIGYSIQQAYSPADKYYFVVKDSAGYKNIELGLSPVFDWTYIVGVKKANYIEAWVNGVKVGSWSGTIGSLSNPSKAFEIGRSAEPYYFNGLIDDVRIYGAALTQAQIQQHYADGLPTHQNLAKNTEPD